MEKLSRVKKYEELRKSIETDNNIDKSIHSHTSEEQAKALETFDSSIFKKVEICRDDSYTPVREKKVEQVEELKAPVDDTFTNEYLDDFIREVREYNIKKGNRESENTQADILYQLNAANRAKRSQYIQEIKEDLPVEEPENVKTVLSKEDIAMEVANLLREEGEAVADIEPESNASYDEELYKTRELNLHVMQPSVPEPVVDEEIREPQEEPVEAYREPEPVIADPEPVVKPNSRKVIQPSILEDEESEEEPLAEELYPKKKGKDTILHKKLLEETQQLRVQMDEYEDELTDLSDGVQKTNKLLNFVLCFLILVLLVIIGFIAYSLWKAGGI